MLTDVELLEAWRAGDREAGSALFERHFESLYVFFHAKVAPDVADDLIQATLLGCLQAKDSYAGKASFRTFLLAIARKRLFDHLRKVSRRGPSVDLEAVSLADLGTSPSRMVGRCEEERLLLEALRALPVDLQTLVELYYWERLSATDLAVVYEVPEGTIRTRLRRARTLLVRYVEQAAGAPSLLQSTVDGLEAWARGLREAVRVA